MRRRVFFVSFILPAALAVVFSLAPTKDGIPEYPRTASIHGVSISLDIADTEEERARGLSGREALKDTEGMLFVFEESGYHGMWMKDMRMAIDIVWIDENSAVVDLRTRVEPGTYPRIFRPSRPSRVVLELASGMVEKTGIKIGDRVEF